MKTINVLLSSNMDSNIRNKIKAELQKFAKAINTTLSVIYEESNKEDYIANIRNKLKAKQNLNIEQRILTIGFITIYKTHNTNQIVIQSAINKLFKNEKLDDAEIKNVDDILSLKIEDIRMQKAEEKRILDMYKSTRDEVERKFIKTCWPEYF